jgi:hypothetical protein
VTVAGKYSGIYITNGTAVPITYEKMSQRSAPKYYDAEGNELPVNRGKTFINIVSAAKKSRVGIEG